MANTGAKLPQSAATAAESPWLDNDWTTPQNIYGAGTASVTAASYDAGDQTYVLKAYNFDMSAIPDGATIDGVVCVVNGYYAVVVVSIDLVQLLNTSLGKTGTNQAATPQALTTGAADYTFGAANNKWGLALDAAWIKNSNFGVAIGCLAGGSGNSNNDVHIDSVTLTVYYTAAASLTVQNGSQAQAAENKLLSQVHNLTSQAAAQGQSEGNVLLVQQHILAIQNAAQAQTTENAVLTQVNILAVAIASEAQTVENIALSQVHNLSPPAVTQPQTVGNVDLVQQHLLAIQNAGQGQSAGNTSLTENKILVVQNASQWQRTRAKNNIIDIDHETGDLSQYSSTVTDSGDLSVSAAAALAGSGYGLSALIDDTVTIYGEKSITANTSRRVRARFYLDVNTLTMVDGNNLGIFSLRNSTTNITFVQLEYDTIGGYIVRAFIFRDDTTSVFTSNGAITDAPHYIEVYLIRATNATSNDGSIQIWIDGTLRSSVTGQDNYDRFDNCSAAHLGAGVVNPIDVGTSGTLYLDELVVNDTGLAIGPVGTLTLEQNHILVAQDANQTQVGENNILVQNAILAIANAIQPQSAENIIFAATLEVQNAAQTQRARVANIFDIDHELGSLGQYTATVTDSGDLSVAAEAGLASSAYGLSVLIDDVTTIYGEKSANPSTTGKVRARIYFDPNTITIPTEQAFGFLALRNSTPAPIAYIGLRYVNAIGYRVISYAYRDDGSTDFIIESVISDQPHYIEIYLTRATNSTSIDGTLKTWIDGVHVGTLTLQDNYDRFNDFASIRVGAGLGDAIDASTAGTLFLDELVINDTGLVIGPADNPLVLAQNHILAVQDASQQQHARIASVIDIDHETGNLSQYTSSVTDSGDLSVSAAAALAGSGYGLSCVIDDTVAIFGRKSIASSALQFRMRFYIDPNSLTMANNDTFVVSKITQNGGTFYSYFVCELRYLTATGYRIIVRGNIDNASEPGYLDGDITDAPHYVEIHVVRATTDISADGTCQLWIDGVSKGITTGLDNYNLFADQTPRVLFGPSDRLDAGTSGTLYLDELLVTNTALVIGPTNNPLLPQVHVLNVQSAAQTQSAANVNLGQPDTLVITNMAQGQSCESILLSQDHNLTIQDAQQGQSSENILLTQVHNLTLANIAQTQTSQNTDLSQVHNLTVAIASQPQNIGVVLLSQAHTLLVSSAGQPQTSEEIALTEHKILTAQNAQQGQTAGNVLLNQVHILVVQNALQGQSATDIELGENIPLFSQNTTQAQVTENILLLQSHNLGVQDAATAQAAESVLLIEHKNLAIQDALQNQVAENILLTQAHALVAQNTVQPQSAEELVLTVHRTLAVQDMAQSQTVAETLLAQVHNLEAQNSGQGSTLENATLSQIHTLLPESAAQPQIATELLLSQAHTLTVQDSTQESASEAPILGQAHSLIVSPATQEQAVDALSLLQNHNLPVENAVQSGTAENVVLVMAGSLAIQGANQPQNAQSPSLIQQHTLLIESANQGQTAGNTDLTQNITLLSESASQSQSANEVQLLVQYQLDGAIDTFQPQSIEQIQLTENSILAIQDAAQSQTCENIALVQNVILSPHNVAQPQSIEEVALITSSFLELQNAAQAQAAENVTLTQIHILAPQDMPQGQTTESMYLIQNYLDFVAQDAYQSQTTTEPVLISGQTLTVQDAAQSQSNETTILLQNYSISVANAIQSQSEESVTLSQVHALFVQSASQPQAIGNVNLYAGTGGDMPIKFLYYKRVRS